MPNQKNENARLINENQLIEKYTITSLIFNKETSAFSHEFPIDRVFETFQEAIDEIVLSLKFEPNVWHTVCPLYLPSELIHETNLSQCLHFDAVTKESIFKTKPEEETQVISIEEVYQENGVDFPKDNSE